MHVLQRKLKTHQSEQKYKHIYIYILRSGTFTFVPKCSHVTSNIHIKINTTRTIAKFVIFINISVFFRFQLFFFAFAHFCSLLLVFARFRLYLILLVLKKKSQHFSSRVFVSGLFMIHNSKRRG